MTLDGETVASLLRTARYGRSLDVRARTGSTNDDARLAAEAGAPDGHVVVADAQDRGRGAHGRTWSSPGGTDLYLSIVARPPLATEGLALVTLATGVAVAETVASHAPAHDVLLKWPNDVLLDDRKCAGILVETSSTGGRPGACVVGIGLDVNRKDLSPELAEVATSLALATGAEHDRAALLAELLLAVETWVDRLVASGPAAVVDALERRLAWRGQRVRCGDDVGRLEGVDARGALRLATDDGAVRTLTSGVLRRA